MTQFLTELNIVTFEAHHIIIWTVWSIYSHLYAMILLYGQVMVPNKE